MKWAEEFLNSYCSDIENSTQLTHERDVSCLLFPNIAVSYQTKTSWVFSVSYLVGRELSRRTPERLLKKPTDQNTRESCRSILNVYLIICPSGALKILTARGPTAVGTGNHCWRTLILHGGDMAPRGQKLVLGVRGDKKIWDITMVCGLPQGHSTWTDTQCICGIKLLSGGWGCD